MPRDVTALTELVLTFADLTSNRAEKTHLVPDDSSIRCVWTMTRRAGAFEKRTRTLHLVPDDSLIRCVWTMTSPCRSEGLIQYKYILLPFRMASSVDITNAIRRYFQELLNFPLDRSLDNSLEAALEAEKEIRLLFGTNPHSPLLENLYLGLVDVFDLHPATRRTRARHTKPRTTDMYKQYVFPVCPTLRRSDLMPSTVHSVEVFQQHWEIFTQGALAKMKTEDWANVLAAGGSVLACLMAPHSQVQSATALNDHFQSNLYASSDIDLFLWGLSPKQAEEKMLDIYQAVCAATPWYVTCVRKANTISIHSQWPRRPIQIILRLYQSPAEVLAGFDVDSACCAYDGKRVWVNPRALTALVRQSNTIDITRRSPSYEARLAKYAQRGFEIYIPSLRREQVVASIYNQDLVNLPNGLARLLVLEAAHYNPQFYRYPGFILKQGLEEPRHVCKDETLNLGDPQSSGGYDSVHGWAQIPYGKTWTAEKIERMIGRKDAWMNSPCNERNEVYENYHRHVFFAGSMRECLGYFCQVCAIIEDMVGPSFAGSQLYIRGSIQFITNNPGQQLLTGSFRPIELGDWAKEAYGKGLEQPFESL